MTARYSVGDTVLIPATIESAELIHGKTAYRIREYPGTPECPTIIWESTIAGLAPVVKANAPQIADAPE